MNNVIAAARLAAQNIDNASRLISESVQRAAFRSSVRLTIINELRLERQDRRRFRSDERLRRIQNWLVSRVWGV